MGVILIRFNEFFKDSGLIKSPAPSWRRMGAVVVAALCGWVGYAVYNEAAVSHSLDVKVKSMTSQNAALRQQNFDLQKNINEANQSAWLEAEARKLGYVMQGEKLYIITTPSAGTSLRAGGGVENQLPTLSPTPTSSSTSTKAKGANPASLSPASNGSLPTPVVFGAPHR